MIITLPLQPEEEASLNAAARARGISTDELVRKALEGVLADSLHPGSSASQEETTGELDASQESAFREREIKIKEREVAAKEQEALAKQEELRRSRWLNPTAIGLFAAALGLIGSVIVARVNNANTQQVERLQSEANLTLEAIKTGTGNTDAACKNLVFFVSLGLVHDPDLKIASQCKYAPAGPPSLPASQSNVRSQVQPQLVVPKAVADFVRGQEKLHLTATADISGVWTVGYGHTGPGVHPGLTITEPQARQFFDADISDAYACLANLVTVPLNTGQRAALTDFVFNLGCASLQSSTFLRNLNQGNYDAVPDELMRWDHAGGVVNPDLEERRRADGVQWNIGKTP